MNKQEKTARRLYEANKQNVEGGKITTMSGLLAIAKEQDRLYKIIHARADAKHFNRTVYP